MKTTTANFGSAAIAIAVLTWGFAANSAPTPQKTGSEHVAQAASVQNVQNVKVAQAKSAAKKTFFVHIMAGSNDPTRAILGLIAVWALADAGHEVTLALSGEAVYLLNDKVAATSVGVGLGSAQSWFKKIKKHNVPVLYCIGCGKARSISDFKVNSIKAKPMTGKVFVDVVAKVDTVISY
jgi:uncharacterized protein involved in oxidation of intracellular sulfur